MRRFNSLQLQHSRGAVKPHPDSSRPLPTQHSGQCKLFQVTVNRFTAIRRLLATIKLRPKMPYQLTAAMAILRLVSHPFSSVAPSETADSGVFPLLKWSQIVGAGSSSYTRCWFDLEMLLCRTIAASSTTFTAEILRLNRKLPPHLSRPRTSSMPQGRPSGCSCPHVTAEHRWDSLLCDCGRHHSLRRSRMVLRCQTPQSHSFRRRIRCQYRFGERGKGTPPTPKVCLFPGRKAC